MFYWKNSSEVLKFSRGSIVVTVLGLMCLASCSRDKEVRSHFFSFDSLITEQVKFLSHAKTKLIKKASLEGRADSTIRDSPDSAGWSKELGVFLQLDVINKAIYRDKYVVHDGRDPMSNLLIRYFDAREESAEGLPVPRLRIYYHGNLNNIKRIEGTYREENSLYASSQFLSLDLQDMHNKTVLTSYSIKGDQKMILADSLEFSIDARIIVN